MSKSSKDFFENLTFVKWAGGKSQLIEQISKFLPKKIERYFEPFIGGGALFFYIMQKYKPKYACICDSNLELIITYKIIRDNLNQLIKKLEEHKLNQEKDNKEFLKHKTEWDLRISKIKQYRNEKKKLESKNILKEFEVEYLKLVSEKSRKLNSEKNIDLKNRYYYQIRDLDTNKLNEIEIAARFIFLNKMCFNGLYRVNPKGQFNVPMGSNDKFNFDVERLKKVSKILNQNVEIISGDYSLIENKLKKGDFIYFDPPYYPLKDKKSFTSYTKLDFGEGQQIDLAEFYKKINKDCKLMLSNSDTKLINDLYKKFNPNKIYAKRMINCDGKNRGAITEVLVTNYKK